MRRRRGWAGRLIALVLLAAAIWIGVEIWRWPAVGRLATERPATTAFIERYRAEPRATGRPARVAWTWTPYAAISPALKRAVLVAEDIGFFSHHGFALAEMQNALEDASRNPLRKGKEALLTWQLERALSKRRILELYLNVVELGPGIYGVGAASQRYFGKAPADLDDGEAAQLAASLPNPTAWHPGATSAAYRRHVASIERRMSRAAFLFKQI